MMFETTYVQTREVEWPASVRKARRRRTSKVANYHNTARPSRLFTPGASPKLEYARPRSQQAHHLQHTFRRSPSQILDLNFLDFPDVNPTSLSAPHQNGYSHIESFVSSSDLYQLDSLPLGSPSISQDISPVRPQVSGMSQDPLDMSWTEVPPWSKNRFTEPSRAPRSGSHDESFQGLESTHLENSGTMASFRSDRHDYGNIGHILGTSPSEELDDYLGNDINATLSSPGSFGSPLSAVAFSFENDHTVSSRDLGSGETYTLQNHLALPNAAASQHDPFSTISTSSALSIQHGDILGYQSNSGTGGNTFLSESMQNYGMQTLEEEYLQPRQADPLSQFLDLENDGWIVPSVPSSSYALSHHSPLSHGSPISAGSPGRSDGNSHHSHAFELSLKPKGRTRSLTAKEKKDAREVRDAKACWACHISKTKCSPCSPGNPCAQCERLVGKRRFCKFDCFNDPLESLYTFMIPEYNMARFSEERVASLLSGVGWSTHKLRIKLSWGYYRKLEADVVAIGPQNGNSHLPMYHHQAIANGPNRPTMVRKQSPPLGVPHEVMDILGAAYSAYVHDIVKTDLWRYAFTGAYDEDDSALPKRLVWAISSYYLRCSQADEECNLIRQAIEMHITSTILERSLILDPDSSEQVQMYLRQNLASGATPRCAQRQIKLLFFTLQRQRIVSVLKTWGNMMWTIHNATNQAEKWTVGFSVFLMLVLVIDKTLGSAYYLCEDRIEQRGAEAEAERSEFRKLVRITETELFGRCKEIFHWKFKTRKAGKEACNPIRDGMEAFRGRPVSDGITHLVEELQSIVGEYDQEIRNHRTFPPTPSIEAPYMDAGRLACIFLDDFLEHI